MQPHSGHPRWSTSQGGSRWSPSLNPPPTSNRELNPAHLSSLSFLFFQVHPSMVVRIWREKGQELRVAGIYERRVQHAFGEGEGKRAPFAKTIFIFFLKGSYKAMIKLRALKEAHKIEKYLSGRVASPIKVL